MKYYDLLKHLFIVFPQMALIQVWFTQIRSFVQSFLRETLPIAWQDPRSYLARFSSFIFDTEPAQQKRSCLPVHPCTRKDEIERRNHPRNVGPWFITPFNYGDIML